MMLVVRLIICPKQTQIASCLFLVCCRIKTVYIGRWATRVIDLYIANIVLASLLALLDEKGSFSESHSFQFLAVKQNIFT